MSRADAFAQTLHDRLAHHHNEYDEFVDDALEQGGLTWRGLGWHDPTPPDLAPGRSLAVVIAARNSAYSLPSVLDSLAGQQTAASVRVIVVDDASTDTTGDIAAAHPTVDIVHRLAERAGSGAARNAGTLLADGVEQLVYLDADMVLPPHVLAGFAARYHPKLVLVGFRHSVPYQLGPDGRPVLPGGEPDLMHDHRVRWEPPAGKPLFYSGLVLDTPIIGWPMLDTHDLRDLGNHRRYHDWDLPRMVVTALVAVPYEAVDRVRGFEPSFGAGWGCDDTYLGAKLIVDGCKVVPVRAARGWHIDPPDADTAWQAKFATAAANVARYRRLLQQPLPTGQLRNDPATARLLAEGTRLK
ncbi:glycosyltransferase family 2 protein [Actinoplanes sp. NPDC051859]|uniref:glycosyltransferase family 2 protein n=1 Tax=Actinoplanes sp. NPDC051859 TaxID=3363909 RepID=UPI0037A09AE8